MNEFIRTVDEIYFKVKKTIENQQQQYRPFKQESFQVKLNYFIEFWCYFLTFPKKEITDFISEENELINDVEELFQKTFLRSKDMKTADIRMVVLMAFVIVVVAYFYDKLSKSKQVKKSTQKIDETISPSLYPVLSRVSTVSPSLAPIQTNFKIILVLVVSATQTPLIDTLKAKNNIDLNDCEKLYEATRYLCQDKETNLKFKWENLQEFIVQSGEESEYDIYLIKIHLYQSDKNFEKDVNQLDRYNAFRNLFNLAVNFEVSPRLYTRAYSYFNVYNR